MNVLDPSFIYPYAGCFLSSVSSQKDLRNITLQSGALVVDTNNDVLGREITELKEVQRDPQGCWHHKSETR